MRPLPHLAAITTALPPHRLDQSNVVARVEQLFGRSPDFERLVQVYANSGIACRYSVMPFEWFDRPQGWAERNRAYLAGALQLIETAAGRALDRAGVARDEVGAVVAVSTTGIATPSLDALLVERLRLPPSTQRLPIFGLGCAGGALGLARAATMAAAMPGKAVLLVVVELCTLQFRRDDLSRSNIVATALFGDGAAAAVLRCGGPAVGPPVAAAGEHTWPDSLDVMGWDVATDGLKAIFSRDIPRLVTAQLRPVLDDFLGQHGLALGDIDRFVCHPGGPKVIDAYETIFGPGFPGAAAARRSLAEYGNMSAVSVLFVLERMIAEARDLGAAWGRALLTALGPGFSAGFVVLGERVTIFYAVLGFVLLQRGGELLLARANTARLLRQGGVEIDRAGYKWFVLLHAGWLAALAAAVPGTMRPEWPLLALFFLLQAGRVWAIAGLGRRWTTRLVMLPDAPPLTRGPYRWVRHPNYLIVAAEVAILPLTFDAITVAVAASACNALLLLRRVRLENAALGFASYHIPETLPRRS